MHRQVRIAPARFCACNVAQVASQDRNVLSLHVLRGNGFGSRMHENLTTHRPDGRALAMLLLTAAHERLRGGMEAGVPLMAARREHELGTGLGPASLGRMRLSWQSISAS